MRLVASDHPALSTSCQAVDDAHLDEVLALYRPASTLMHKLRGVGLAANQVGDLRSWFVWSYGMCVNARILYSSTNRTEAYEGCLSKPGCHVKVSRPSEIWVSYLDERGISMSKTLTGLAARVFYHEYDHTLGICIFPSPVSSITSPSLSSL